MTSSLDFIQSKIECGGFEADIGRKNSAAICLLEKLEGKLDKYQLRALQIANQHIYDQSKKEIEEIVEALHSSLKAEIKSEAAKTRLALSALDINEGLSGYMAEFLVEWGEEAGISDNEILECLTKAVRE